MKVNAKSSLEKTIDRKDSLGVGTKTSSGMTINGKVSLEQFKKGCLLTRQSGLDVGFGWVKIFSLLLSFLPLVGFKFRVTWTKTIMC